MTRKLHNSLLALSSSGLVLVAALLLSQPLPGAHAPQPALAVAPAPVATRIEHAARRAAAANLRSHRGEARAADAEDAATAIGRTAALVAEIAATAALSALAAEAEAAARANAQDGGDDRPAPTAHQGHHRAIAVPYFSFARASRGIGD